MNNFFFFFFFFKLKEEQRNQGKEISNWTRVFCNAYTPSEVMKIQRVEAHGYPKTKNPCEKYSIDRR